MKILLSAFACLPNRGSEPGVGWNWARALSQEHDVWVLTNARNRLEISESSEHLPVRWVFVAGPAGRNRHQVLAWMKRYLWQVAAYRHARVLHREVAFDLAHHVTLATWRLPSLLWRLGIPLVWGPLGGGQETPRGFASELGSSGRRQELVRAVFQVLSRRDPLVRQTLAHSRVVIAANRPTRDLLIRMGHRNVRTALDVALTPPDEPPFERPAGGPLRILWAGAFTPRKALPLLLKALAMVSPAVSWHLDVVGDGVERQRWRQVAKTLGLESRVSFFGRLPHGEALGMFRKADVFVFSSLRDTSGTVLLEAMGAGVPIVALAWSGTPEVVTEECAVLIPPTSPAQATHDLARAIERLASSPEARRRMGEAARLRLTEAFGCEHLAVRAGAWYSEALGVDPSELRSEGGRQ